MQGHDGGMGTGFRGGAKAEVAERGRGVEGQKECQLTVRSASHASTVLIVLPIYVKCDLLVLSGKHWG